MGQNFSYSTFSGCENIGTSYRLYIPPLGQVTARVQQVYYLPPISDAELSYSAASFSCPLIGSLYTRLTLHSSLVGKLSGYLLLRLSVSQYPELSASTKDHRLLCEQSAHHKWSCRLGSVNLDPLQALKSPHTKLQGFFCSYVKINR